MRPEPTQTPPQQRFNPDSMDNGAPASSYAINGGQAALQAPPLDGNMDMMEQYSPVSPTTYRDRHASAPNSQGFQHPQDYPSQRQLASPISLSMDVPAQYAQVSPIVTCVGTSPMVTYATSSSLSAYNMMNPTSYPTGAVFQSPYTSVPMSYPNNNLQTYSPQMAHQLNQRLLSVEVPHSTPATTNPHSPVYNSDSHSSWSTPSDMSKSHTWPPHTPRDRAFSAPGSQYPPPIMDLSAQYYQHQMARRPQPPQTGMGLGFEGQDFAVCDDDCVSTTATFGGTDAESEAEANDYQYTAEMQLQQEQFEAQGGGPAQQIYMEGIYEQQNGQIDY